MLSKQPAIRNGRLKEQEALPEPWIFAMADDLTGALEAGSKFAARGFVARVTSNACVSEPSAPVFVIDTETRHLSPPEAARVVQDASLRMAEHQPWLVYKKTDSTLRGNIAAEVEALVQSFPARQVVYVPAYPAMGRTVRNGQLLVDGVPVHQTSFAADPLNPIRDSAVQAALGDIQAIILDGESDEDISAAARHILALEAPVLVLGPGAIAAALADVLPPTAVVCPCVPPLRRCLLVNGSMHPTSAAQVDYAIYHGLLTAGWTLFEYEGEQTGVERAVRLGERVKQYLQDHAVDALIIFGGDTVFGIHRALGAPDFTCRGEVLPGVPISDAGGLSWITKAGGFGKANVVEELKRALLL